MSIAIYMEGGGNSRDTKVALRTGMDALLGTLKQSARERELHWTLVCCGPRNEAFRRFRNALRDRNYGTVVLLVDAEDPVAMEPGAHLQARDGWDMAGIEANLIHLMVQTMEAWIVADANALRGYYGQGFNAGVLPRAADLEGVAKRDLENSLHRATERTRKGTYHKIRHASDLLQRIDPETVKARCHHCERLFIDVGRLIDAA